VIRLRAPLSGETAIEDQVQGRVVWQNENLDDLVLLRSDGTPTYMLAVVVDDHDMGVTHIIRGDDHLTNGARQTQIYNALGWQVPVMAHIPLIHGPDGAKLSSATAPSASAPYKPWAICGGAAQLPGAARRTTATGRSFRPGVGPSTPKVGALRRVSALQLGSINGHYIRQARDTDLVAAIERLLPHIANGAELAAKFTSDLKAKFCAAMPGLKERAKNLVELIDSAQFLYAERPIAIDQKAKPLLGPQACAIIAELLPDLSKVEPWTAAAIESVVRAFVGQRPQLGAVANARAAPTLAARPRPAF
jgi:glutamyl-tRNA synthetase